MENPNKITRILESTVGKSEMEPNPYLFTKIVAKISAEETRVFSPIKIALVSLSFMILVAINVFGFALQEQTNSSDANSEQLAIEESQNINSNFHLY